MRGFSTILLSGALQPLKGWETLVLRINSIVLSFQAEIMSVLANLFKNQISVDVARLVWQIELSFDDVRDDTSRRSVESYSFDCCRSFLAILKLKHK